LNNRKAPTRVSRSEAEPLSRPTVAIEINKLQKQATLLVCRGVIVTYMIFSFFYLMQNGRKRKPQGPLKQLLRTERSEDSPGIATDGKPVGLGQKQWQN
jgi:hypothetical protein